MTSQVDHRIPRRIHTFPPPATMRPICPVHPRLASGPSPRRAPFSRVAWRKATHARGLALLQICGYRVHRARHAHHRWVAWGGPRHPDPYRKWLERSASETPSVDRVPIPPILTTRCVYAAIPPPHGAARPIFPPSRGFNQPCERGVKRGGGSGRWRVPDSCK